VRLTSARGTLVVDAVALLPGGATGVEELLSGNGAKVRAIRRESAVSYAVEVAASREFYLVLKEAFHPDLRAWSEGVEVQSLPSHFGLNSFRIPAAKRKTTTVQISFVRESRNRVLWLINAVMSLLMVGVAFSVDRRRAELATHSLTWEPSEDVSSARGEVM
jgi:hypothetical protein